MDINDIKISVVIPFFNSSMYLNRLYIALKPYLSRSDIEIIFIDDCSECKENIILSRKINEWKLIDNIFLFKNFVNLGAAYSRYIGVLKSKGDYIAFLDSDDVWVNSKLDYQYGIMSQCDYVISGCSNIIKDEEFLLSTDFLNWKFQYKIREITYRKFFFYNYYSTPSVMVKRDYIVNNNFSEKMRYSEDFDCWRRVLLDGKGVIIEDLGVFSFKHHYNSSVGLSSHRFKMALGELNGLFKILKDPRLNSFDIILAVLGLFFSLIKSLRRFLIYFFFKG